MSNTEITVDLNRHKAMVPSTFQNLHVQGATYPLGNLGIFSTDALRQENQRLWFRVLCARCSLLVKKVLFLPCFCLKFCTQCAKEMKHCPDCMIEIRKKIEVKH